MSPGLLQFRILLIAPRLRCNVLHLSVNLGNLGDNHFGVGRVILELSFVALELAFVVLELC